MKLATVFHFPEYGGPQNQTVRLSPILRDLGVETVALAPAGSGADRIAASGVVVIPVSISRVRATKDIRVNLRMALAFPRDVTVLRRHFKSSRPDVVQLNNLMNPHAAIAARSLGIPVVWQLLDTFPPRWIRRIMMYPVRALADVIMPIGHRVAEAHPGAHAFVNRSVVFYPPVDATTFGPNGDSALRPELGISSEDPVVTVVGNVNRQKGHEHFIRSAAILKRRFPNVRFVIAGAIHDTHVGYFEQLKSLAKESGLTLNQDIFFLGSRLDIPNLMNGSDVFALASIPNSEGTPTVILEAMASGLPVVATDVGSVREVIEDGVTGFVVPPLDHQSMANRIGDLLDDAAMRYSFGAKSRVRVESEFSLERCAQAHLSAYELAIAHRRSKGKTKSASS